MVSLPCTIWTMTEERCQSLANYLQNSSIPLQFIQMMPYLIIIIAYTVYCAMVEHNKKKKQMKAAVGK